MKRRSSPTFKRISCTRRELRVSERAAREEFFAAMLQ